jgi:hypothetical protein
MAASHELLEMLKDPSSLATRGGYPFEICDPVETAGYDIRGVTVSDFVTPSWFTRRGAGRWDYLGLLNGPRRQLTAHDYWARLPARPGRNQFENSVSQTH